MEHKFLGFRHFPTAFSYYLMKQRRTKKDVRSHLKNVAVQEKFIFPSFQDRHGSLGTASLITAIYRSQKKKKIAGPVHEN
jgi:hypothetical protein